MHSLADRDTAVRVALDSYVLEATSVAPLQGGLQPQTWRVECGAQRFVLREYADDPATLRFALAERSWLAELSARLPGRVPRPIPSGTNSLAPVRVDGTDVRWFGLAAWVDGSQRDEAPSPDAIADLGALTAAMHFAAIDWDEVAREFVWRTYGPSVFDAGWLRLRYEVEPAIGVDRACTLDQAVKRACQQLREISADRRLCGVIHADLHLGNVVWGSDPLRPNAIDFARVGYGSFAFDVAMLQHFLPQQLWPDVLAGYCRVRELAQQERDFLPAARLLAAIENFSILVAEPNERAGVIADVGYLEACASALVPAP